VIQPFCNPVDEKKQLRDGLEVANSTLLGESNLGKTKKKSPRTFKRSSTIKKNLDIPDTPAGRASRDSPLKFRRAASRRFSMVRQGTLTDIGKPAKGSDQGSKDRNT
jgi:hypothetical protein